MLRHWAGPILFIAFLGCGQTPEPIKAHKVTGQVYYNGKPAKGVSVFLSPMDAPMVPAIPSNPFGKTGKDGAFSLSTFAENDGAPEGKYQILLLWHDEESKEEAKPDRFLGWYGGVHSKLTFIVKAGENTIPQIQVPLITRPPEQLPGIPGKN